MTFIDKNKHDINQGYLLFPLYPVIGFGKTE